MNPIVPSNTFAVSFKAGNLAWTSFVIARAAAFASNPFVVGTSRPQMIPPGILYSEVAIALSTAFARSPILIVEALVTKGVPPSKV